jgi:hypothetical protein
MIDVTLRIDLIGANKLLRMHWRERKQLRIDCLNYLLVAGVKTRTPEPVKQRVSITRILGPRQRSFDTDNAYAACKNLLDCLQIKGMIFDDSPAWIDLTVEEDSANRSAGPAVRVRVEAVE